MTTERIFRNIYGHTMDFNSKNININSIVCKCMNLVIRNPVNI